MDFIFCYLKKAAQFKTSFILRKTMDMSTFLLLPVRHWEYFAVTTNIWIVKSKDKHSTSQGRYISHFTFVVTCFVCALPSHAHQCLLYVITSDVYKNQYDISRSLPVTRMNRYIFSLRPSYVHPYVQCQVNYFSRNTVSVNRNVVQTHSWVVLGDSSLGLIFWKRNLVIHCLWYMKVLEKIQREACKRKK